MFLFLDPSFYCVISCTLISPKSFYRSNFSRDIENNIILTKNASDMLQKMDTRKPDDYCSCCHCQRVSSSKQ
jgi:hypothetical protein